MKAKIIRALQFLRILDEERNLSLTNLALAAALIYLLTRPDISVADVATFVATVAGYQIKRYVQRKKPTNDQKVLQKAIDKLQT